MGKVNICLKRSFVCVISVIGGIGIVLLGFTLFGHGVLHGHEEAEHAILGVHLMYSFSAVILLFAIFGAVGIWKEKKWALIVFTVGMSLGCLYMLVIECIAMVALPQLENNLQEEYLSILHVSNGSDLINIDSLQSEAHCCGLKGYTDWEDNIPQSCHCPEESSVHCVEVPVNGKQSQDTSATFIKVYSKPCLSLLVAEDMKYIKIILSVMMGFIILWVLSIGLGIAILCQLNKKVETPKVVYSSEAITGNYQVLEEDIVNGTNGS